MTNVTRLFKAPPQPKSEAFDEFWRVYPRRKDKLDARRAWDKALKIATAEEIIEGAKRYARTAEAPFIKLPATFLNKGSWMDEEPEPIAAKSAEECEDERLRGIAARWWRKPETKFMRDWRENNVTEQDMRAMRERGLIE